jgi:hypothetical protein
MRFKITQAKPSTNPIMPSKIGQTILTLNQTPNLLKSFEQSTNTALACRFEEQKAFQNQAEQRRNEARVYASITPIR